MRVLFVSAILVLADQTSKAIVVRTMSLYESIPIVQNFFHFTYITNDGMAFGIDFPFGYLIFSSVSVLLTVFLFFYLWSVKNHSIVISNPFLKPLIPQYLGSQLVIEIIFSLHP